MNTEPNMVNWEDIHRRLAAARGRLDLSWTPDAQETRRILRERARALAREATREAGSGEQVEFLEFALAQERYGFETSHVQEVAAVTAVTPVPCTPSFVAGLISLRGQILSVIDLGKYFDLAASEPVELDQVVVLSTEAMLVGVLASAIIGLGSVAREDLETSLPTLAGRRARYLQGVSRTGVAIIDAQSLLSDPEIVVHADVAA